jgi:hypothetical protein
MKLRSLAVLSIFVIAGACATTSNQADTADVEAEAVTDEIEQEVEEQTTAGIGEQCGTIANIQCAEDAFCDYEADQVALDDGSGTCAERPSACDEVEGEAATPVCGRDTKTYDSECLAHMAGVDVVLEGAETICKPAE